MLIQWTKNIFRNSHTLESSSSGTVFSRHYEAIGVKLGYFFLFQLLYFGTCSGPEFPHLQNGKQVPGLYTWSLSMFCPDPHGIFHPQQVDASDSPYSHHIPPGTMCRAESTFMWSHPPYLCLPVFRKPEQRGGSIGQKRGGAGSYLWLRLSTRCRDRVPKCSVFLSVKHMSYILSLLLPRG